MATSTNNERFARHGLVGIRKALRDRFAGDLVIRGAVSKVLDEIVDEWDAREPLHASSFDLLVDAIRRPIEALENGPASDAKAAAEQLARAWNQVRSKLQWG